ncbi:MAG: cell envelope biogenesis protein OmpA, partial [Burkholderiales bacterium]|nr:cell envelope biogenesis protein OmpA [Burkholderiales bacterium]
MAFDRFVMASLLACSVGSSAWAQVAAGEPSAPVEISGTVPNDAVRAALVSRMMSLYGRERVVDRLTLGDGKAATPWQQDVNRLLPSSIKQVSNGQLTMEGRVLDIRGEVSSEAVRQQVIADLTQAAGQSYSVRHHLQ